MVRKKDAPRIKIIREALTLCLNHNVINRKKACDKDKHIKEKATKEANHITDLTQYMFFNGLSKSKSE